MELALKHLRELYDFIIIDTTPVEPVIDATILSRRVDKVIFAVKWATTPREAIAHALRQIPGDKKVAGIAMTIVDERKTPKYGPYSYYGSSYYSDYYSQ
jgi:Mrp family chromosome partitioning ATPase